MGFFIAHKKTTFHNFFAKRFEVKLRRVQTERMYSDLEAFVIIIVESALRAMAIPPSFGIIV